jgi:hypothetical protein
MFQLPLLKIKTDLQELYRISKNGVVDIKNEWTFLNEIRQFGIDNKQQMTTTGTTPRQNYVYIGS